MYKPATSALPIPEHLWHVGGAVSFFAGPQGRNDVHAHSTAVLLTGLYGDLRVRFEDQDWLRCQAAVVPAGVRYEFDMAGEPLSVLYVEPEIAGTDALAPLLSNHAEAGRALVGSAADVRLFREFFEHRATSDDALLDIVRFSKSRASKHIDPRICQVLGQLSASSERSDAIADLASNVGLSVSRFQHLFSEEVGVPLRRYRTWQRLRRAIKDVCNGSRLVDAALNAGFYDQAHFSREFRRTFGAPASRGLKSR